MYGLYQQTMVLFYHQVILLVIVEKLSGLISLVLGKINPLAQMPVKAYLKLAIMNVSDFVILVNAQMSHVLPLAAKQDLFVHIFVVTNVMELKNVQKR
jgi:hypothetical protein